jgi:hypothetical protein
MRVTFPMSLPDNRRVRYRSDRTLREGHPAPNYTSSVRQTEVLTRQTPGLPPGIGFFRLAPYECIMNGESLRHDRASTQDGLPHHAKSDARIWYRSLLHDIHPHSLLIRARGRSSPFLPLSCKVPTRQRHKVMTCQLYCGYVSLETIDSGTVDFPMHEAIPRLPRTFATSTISIQNLQDSHPLCHLVMLNDSGNSAIW